jgi:large subunit ribosomal protein L10
MPSQKNVNYLEKTKERMKEVTALYFTDFTGLSVKSLEKLRKELKKSNGSYLVLKNTLGFLALRDLGYNEKETKQLFVGPTGIVIAFDDPIALAKIIAGHKDLKIKGSFIEGKYYNREGVIEFSRIPSKDVLLAQLAGSLNMLGNLASVCEGILRNLISTVEALKKKEAK